MNVLRWTTPLKGCSHRFWVVAGLLLVAENGEMAVLAPSAVFGTTIEENGESRACTATSLQPVTSQPQPGSDGSAPFKGVVQQAGCNPEVK